jgi:hypothetical protein
MFKGSSPFSIVLSLYDIDSIVIFVAELDVVGCAAGCVAGCVPG